MVFHWLEAISMKNPLSVLSVFLLHTITCFLLVVPPACATEVARIGMTSYPSLTSAYSAAVSGDVIRTVNSVLPDNGLSIHAAMGGGKSVTIRGGYQADFIENSRSGVPTVLAGALIISSGTLKVDRLAVRGKQSQSISGFNPPSTATFGDTAITLTATASSGLPVTFKVISGSGSVTGNLLTIVGAGIIRLAASQSGNSSYDAAAEVSAAVNVSPAFQAITFPAFSPVFLGNTDFTPGATSSSGLSVNYTGDNPAVATIQNGLIHLTGVGQTSITARQAGNSNYQAATPVMQSLSVALPLSPIDNSGLESYWPLDGDWHDVLGRHDLTPATPGGFSAAPNVRSWNNQAYGPTKSETGNGAVNSSFTTLSEDNGITLEGWVWLPDDGTGGALFGFNGNGWGEPYFSVSIGWGFLWVTIGKSGDGLGIQYSRIGDTCWHHVALVVPKGFRNGIPVRLYLDGHEDAINSIDSSASGTAALGPASTLFGSPFTVGQFVSLSGSGSAGNMKIDEVRVWSRELTESEISTLATRSGSGSSSENSPIPQWAPGPRFVPPTEMPVPRTVLGVHVLTDDTIAVITDPTSWIKERFIADCGTYLRAMEPYRSKLDWQYGQNYEFAAMEVIAHYRPPILAALADSRHFSISTAGSAIDGITLLSIWPQAMREFRTPLFSGGGEEQHLTSAEVAFYSFLKLPARMINGRSYSITDAWGNTASWTYDESRTVSWALKVDQAGYLGDAAAKYAYLGGWLGPSGGPLNLDRFNGAPFNICRENDNTPVFSGTITYRGDETQPVHGITSISGERVYQLDFSSFTTPGHYYVRVPGAGRSWSFEIGDGSAGAAFYTHARGLYHQRCSSLDSSHTAWPRGDRHYPVYKASFPTQPFNDYVDHSAEGWGFLDQSGAYPGWAGLAGSWFPVVASKMTDEVAAETSGEWHDAGDFDRAGNFHLNTVEYLTEAYMMFPGNFADGQLNIPESGNGLPDILDEAVWGVDLWRRLQEPDGRVALWVESYAHPQITSDPGQDTQPYYKGLATRGSSITYAEHAARLARALQLAGDTSGRAGLFLASARRAYAFAMTDYTALPRISMSFALEGQPLSWIEPPSPERGAVAKALVQLWLASGDPVYYEAMNTPEMTQVFKTEVTSLYWRGNSLDFIDAALAPGLFPPEWGNAAKAGIVSTATEWLTGQSDYAYRTLWRSFDHGYFPLMGWGNNEYHPILHLIAAWKLTGEEKYRSGALTAVNFLQGANPQGRSLTTGLGSNYVIYPLHLPTYADGLADPVPGITIYGYNSGIPWQTRNSVYGLFSDPSPGMQFNGTAIAQLPPPWNDPGLEPAAIGNILYAGLPLYRNLINLEAYNVPQMEFDVTMTVGAATAVLGSLMKPGWMPSEALIHRQPKSAAELQDAIWFQP
jgi:hypothetical protein